MRFWASTILLSALAVGIAPTSVAHAEGLLADPTDRCEVSSARIDWGFKESFRAYLSGSIAQGRWDTTGNVTYATPTFSLDFTDGDISPQGNAGSLKTDGSIRFFGHGGILDQTVSNPRLVLESSKTAALYFDVRGDTQEGVAVDEAAVRFAEVTIRRYAVDPAAGVWSVVDAPVELTEDGARAFGTYPSGEALDPMDITIRVSPGCLEQDNLLAVWIVGGGVATVILVTTAVSIRRLRERRSLGRERPE